MPHVAPLQPGPAIVQVTAVLLALVTVAVNACVPFEETLAEVGAMLTATGGGVLSVTVPLADLVGSA